MLTVRHSRWFVGVIAVAVFAVTAEATDCNSNGISDSNGIAECGPLEVVILLDTSNSMPGAVADICSSTESLRDELDALIAAGMDLTYEILDLGAGYSSGETDDGGEKSVTCSSDCCDSNGVAGNYGTTTTGSSFTLGDCSTTGVIEGNREDWGVAIAIVAAEKNWAAESTRLIIPVSDEGPRCGNVLLPNDTTSIQEAIPIAWTHRVMVSPVIVLTSITLPGTHELAEMMAAGAFPGSEATMASESTVVEAIKAIVEGACAWTYDCNANGVPDDCDIGGGTSDDCNSNAVPDDCEPDCNLNGTADSCDVDAGTSQDCQPNRIPDECEPDCNANDTPDDCDIAEGTSEDCTEDGIPDECEPDCNGNGVADSCDIAGATSQDCDGGGVPDECIPVIYVDADASGANTGKSWVDAYTDLQSALAICGNLPCYDVEIWVAEGRYHPVDGGQDPREKSFELCGGGLAIYGGFDPGAGVDEFYERDPAIYETILSGDLDDNDGSGITSDNSYSVVTVHSTGAWETGVLDGFTIRDGNSNHGSTFAWRNGGGVFVVGVAQPTGPYNSMKPAIRNCRIVDNHAQVSGGGAYIANSRYWGDAAFQDCTFQDNTVTEGSGAALMLSNSPAQEKQILTVIRRCYFINNVTASGEATGGGGCIVADESAVQLLNCVFLDNESDYGGGVDIWGSTAELVNCTFTGNRAFVSGGAVEVSHPLETGAAADATLHNCIFWDNSADGVDCGPELANALGSSTTIEVAESDVKGGLSDIDTSGGGTVDYTGNNNIETNPRFTGTIGQLASDSDCIDAGDNSYVPAGMTTDILGNPRIADGGSGAATVDMGAYELILPECLPADVNCDGTADVLDMGIIRQGANWNQSPPEVPRADINCDGTADVLDQGIIRQGANWNVSTGPCLCDPESCGGWTPMMPGGGTGDGLGDNSLSGTLGGAVTILGSNDLGEGGGSPAPTTWTAGDSTVASSAVGGADSGSSVGGIVMSTGGWTYSYADASLEVRPAGSGDAVSALAPSTTYQLRYLSEHAYVNAMVVFASTDAAGAGIASLSQPASGPWAGAEPFTVSDWADATGGAVAVGGGLYSHATVAADLSSTTSAGDTAAVLTFKSGTGGTARFDAVLWDLDVASATWTEMTATIELAVE